MKKTILLTAIIFCAANLFAQNLPKLEISATPSLIFPFKNVDSKMSFGVGAKASLVFFDEKRVNVLVGLAYQFERYRYDHQSYGVIYGGEENFSHKISAHYLAIPFAVRLNILKNFYTELGINAAYNFEVSDKIKVSGTDWDGSPIKEASITEMDFPSPSSRITSAFNFCIGRSFDLNQKIGLLTQIGYSQMVLAYQNESDNAGVVELDFKGRLSEQNLNLKVPRLYFAIGLRF